MSTNVMAAGDVRQGPGRVRSRAVVLVLLLGIVLGGAPPAALARGTTLAGGGVAPAHVTRFPKGTVMELHRRLVRITIKDFAFHPAKVAVSPGTTIVWTNQDSDPHTVDSTANLWSSEGLDTGGTFTHLFRKAGSFPYYCSVHPFMHGLIIVSA